MTTFDQHDLKYKMAQFYRIRPGPDFHKISAGSFRLYLEDYRFKVIMDLSSLRWLHNLKNPTGRIARWALELIEYDYSIEHRKGALRHVPDVLSRIYEFAGEFCAVALTNDNW
jgi:hypothetical protein